MSRRLTVLVVDDDLAVVRLIRRALEEEGYRVLHAEGTLSVEVARRHRPDLILLDVLMPGRMNGVEVSQKLRTTPATAHIPIISMSGHLRATTPFAMQAEDHLPKPFDLDTLVATIARWIGSPRTEEHPE